MRSLTIYALLQYGQKLYDRGDFNEACAVFDHVLTYDVHQRQALQFLKAMGRAPAPNPGSIMQPQESMVLVPLQKNIVAGKFDVPLLNTVDISDTESMKKAIEDKKRVIEKLRVQIMQIRANLAAQSAKEQ